MYDCPGKEDEEECSTCPGLYRCLSSRLCLLDIHLCDGAFHCPLRDDEWLCNVTCPDKCSCYGLAFKCMDRILADVHSYPDLRYLDVDGGGGGDELVEGRLQENKLLIHLSITGGRLTRFFNISLPNVISLDLRDNHIACLCHVDFNQLKSLRFLVLSDNPLTSAAVHLPFSSSVALPLFVLDLANSKIPQLTLSHFGVFPNLHTLNLSGCSTHRITGAASQLPDELRVLDLSGCPVTGFPRHVFKQLVHLQALFGSSYRVCCSQLLPEGFNLHNCLAPSDPISDCDRLLKDNMHVIFTAIATVLAVLGNVAALGTRIVRPTTSEANFRALMLHLCVSDGMMGIYLAIVSVASWTFQGSYLWHDTSWRRSEACHMSAFLSVLSSQVSAGIVCLVTLDALQTHYVWMARVRFQPRSVYLLCTATWLAGVAVAMVTALPVLSIRRGISDHALCTPMLVSQHTDVYTVIASVIIFNDVLHILTGVGEVSIFLQRLFRQGADSPALNSDTFADGNKTLVLYYIGTSKILCWFIVSLPVTMALCNTTMPQGIPVNISVFVLPLNAALNPLLSALAVVVSRRRQVQKARLMKILAARLASK